MIYIIKEKLENLRTFEVDNNMNKVKNVLSIDMDYIMGPCIELYNNLIGQAPYNEYSPEDFWEKLNEFLNIQQFLTYDEQKLLFLVKVFSKAIANVPSERILFAIEHDMILNLLCTAQASAEERFEIYNLDHHHDIYYDGRQRDEAERFSFASPANWVYYLGTNNKIEEYHWLRNKNSAMFPIEEQKDLFFPVDLNTPEEKLEGITFDYVFVCLSKKYYPVKFQQYFDMLVLIAEGVKGKTFEVCTESYCMDGKSRMLSQVR